MPDKWQERLRGRVAIVEVAERVHGEYHVIDAGCLSALDLCGRNPPGAKRQASALVKFPVGRDCVAGGVLGAIRVVKVRYPVVPIVGIRAAQIRTRDEGDVAADLELGLKDVAVIGPVAHRLAVIEQKHRYSAGSRRDLSVEFSARDRADKHAQLEPT